MIALAALLAAGCASAEPLYGLPPFLESDPAGDGSEDSVLRPFFRVREAPPTAAAARKDVHYLFPLGHYRRRSADVLHRLYPFFLWQARTDDDGFTATDLLVFPFVFAGDHPGEGGYFTLWPFGGTLRGLLGKEYIFHVLFPLFAYTRIHEYESYHVLFPLFGWQAGSGNEGFRILPFYGHQRKSRGGVVISDRYAVLWPLFTWEHDNLNSANPFTAYAIFPFYGETRSAKVDETTVLWPLFRKRVEKADGITRYRLPFPFLMIATGNERQYDFWPIYGYRENAGFTRHFALWPIVRLERHDTGKVVESRRWILPFVWLFERRAKEDDRVVYAQRKLWPLFRVDRGADGAFGVHAPSLLWFKDDPAGTFETVLTPVLEAFRYGNDPGKGRELRLLFSAFHARWERSRGDDGWSLLGGLLGSRTTREGERRVRLFWFVEV